MTDSRKCLDCGHSLAGRGRAAKRCIRCAENHRKGKNREWHSVKRLREISRWAGE